MSKRFFLFAAIAALLVSCGKVDLPDPVIHNFSASPISLAASDTITFTIDAEGDFVTLYDGKTTLDISGEEMPYTHSTMRLKLSFRITPPADTLYPKIVVTNVYDTDNIISVRDSIQVILLPDPE